MLTIEPHGGLCNRMRAIHSAIQLARDTGHSLRLLWRISPDCGAPLDTLLEVPSEFCVVVTKNRMTTDRVLKVTENLKILCHWPPLRRDLSWREVRRLETEEADFAVLARRRNFHIEAVTMFYGAQRPFFPFRPVPKLRERITDFARGFENLIGVHIRRTDNVVARETSPTSLYIAEMKRILAKTPAQKFFVATDDPAEIEEVRKKFPGNIVAHPSPTFDRSSQAALEHAVVELFSLARTQRILGSAGSSFSEVAGRLGDIPLTIISSDTSPTHKG